MKRRPRLVRIRLAPRRPVFAAAKTRGAWKAIVLTWRRAASRNAHPRRSEIGRVSGSWARYFAFQFNFSESRTPRLALPPLPPQLLRETVRRDFRTETRSKHSLLRQTSSLVVRGDVDREHRETLFRNRTIGETSFSELRRTFRFDQLNVARIFSRDVADLRRRTPAHGVRSAPRRSTTRLPGFFRESREPFVRQVKLSLMLGAPQPHRAIVLEQRARTAAEIVWRAQTSPSSDGHLDLTVPALALASADATSTGSAAAQAFATPLANSTAGFDSALIDRVAEDVIGRVERRIRIERERRGL